LQPINILKENFIEEVYKKEDLQTVANIYNHTKRYKSICPMKTIRNLFLLFFGIKSCKQRIFPKSPLSSFIIFHPHPFYFSKKKITE